MDCTKPLYFDCMMNFHRFFSNCILPLAPLIQVSFKISGSVLSDNVNSLIPFIPKYCSNNCTSLLKALLFFILLLFCNVIRHRAIKDTWSLLLHKFGMDHMRRVTLWVRENLHVVVKPSKNLLLSAPKRWLGCPSGRWHRLGRILHPDLVTVQYLRI